ncbi:hypothetical protein C8A03DRAFT_34430 [Achaetomium macrosporum]|uniref:SGNH hydrolase-type esterase domain-containing protein n=1 Tax=Achaetomium macrosporum TaxID=79813 RepID=A0AAN7C9T4_9PEZI|nr:hypothetical protein C8A03DRAFT_34430 [Achaetomium macrosporum]
MTAWPANRNFFGLGDSYTAGIGADCGDITEDQPPGRKVAGSPRSIFKFYACNGAKTGGVVDRPDPGKNSQVRQMKEYGVFEEFGFSTLSIGGIMDLATVPDFKLFVTGYGRFFNDHTDWCNDKYLFPYKIPFWYRAELTRELRIKANAMTADLNTKIAEVVNNVNQQYINSGSKKRIYYIETDRTYENNRWRDGQYRVAWRDDTFFFNIRSDDLKPHGTVVAGDPSPVIIDIGGINTATCMDEAGDDSRMIRCVAAQQYAENSGDPSDLDVVYLADDGSGATIQIVDSGKFTSSGAILDKWAKAFHPKTYPLANIASRVYQNRIGLR